jgi:peptidoglycan/LPS O-acetylase OafA/YrhL
LVIGIIAFVAVSHFIGESAITDWLAALGIGTLTGLMDGKVPLALSNVCAVIAKYSYGIYLSHLPLMIVCFGGGFSYLRFLSFSALTVVVPIVLFHAIEHPMIIVGNKVAGLLRQPLNRPSALIASVSE